MARKTAKRSILIAAGGLLLLWVALIRWGGIETPLQTVNGIALLTAADMPGVTCRRQVIPVKLSASGILNYNVVGDLCWQGARARSILQVLVSGAGYGMVYWDFPYRPETYSYSRAALKRNYTTFNFYRLGMGESDHPFGMLLDVDRQAYVLDQIISALRAENDYAAVVTLGHSFGSTIALAHGISYPENLNGVVLTGFAHNVNPGFGRAMRDGVDIAAVRGPFAGRMIDPTYLISKEDSRGDIFYTAGSSDPTVIEIDERNRQTTTIGEVASTARYFGPQSRALAVPALILVGEDDFVVCGGELDCQDHGAVVAHEQGFFPPAACLEVVVLESTNHNANLHLNAQGNFDLMLDWIRRRAGSGDGQSASEPCRAAKIDTF